MKIGMLTSGGDCQGLNAALRGVAKALYQEFGTAVTIYGIRDGYRGLIEGDYHPMEPQDFSDILTRGGTILGTSRQPFKTMQQAEENEATKLEKMLDTCRRARFDCLVILGGNGTHKTANLLSEHGIPIVTLPKTIDNDLWGTQVTFGFQSAMNIAVEVIDSIHSTAFSHSRVFIVEIMGHKAGWLTLHAGIASGADVIVIPEIPYDARAIAAAIQQRAREGKRFSIVAVAEGAISREEAAMSKKDFKAARAAMPYPSISYRLADELQKITSQEIRVTIPGHFQRGGAPLCGRPPAVHAPRRGGGGAHPRGKVRQHGCRAERPHRAGAAQGSCRTAQDRPGGRRARPCGAGAWPLYGRLKKWVSSKKRR